MRVVYNVRYRARDKKWTVNRQGRRPTRVVRLKSDAVRIAKEYASVWAKGQVKVFKMNGQIQVEYTYGDDPRRYRG